MASVLVAASLLVVLLGSARVYAQEQQSPPPPQPQQSDDERARLHFDAGRSHYEEGAYEQALEQFTRSYELSHRAPLLSNIANCEERLGRWAAAADHLEEFIQSLEENAQQRETLTRRVANLRSRAASNEPPPDAGSPPAARPASDGLLVPALATIGIGGASLIAFAIVGGLALAEEGRIAGGCGATMSCTAAEAQGMGDLAIGADVALSLGLVAVAVGVVLLIVDPPRGASRASIAPFVTADAGGIVIAGRM